MSTELLSKLIFGCGVVHFCILTASALVPIRLKWKEEFRSLSRLHAQMYWVYGGYVVLSIVAFGLISLFNSVELAAGSRLARSFCGYVAVFWAIRVSLQPVLAVEEHLKTWWLRLGYHSLTVVFVCFTLTFGWAALRPA